MEEVVMYTVTQLTTLLQDSNVPPNEIAAIINQGNPYDNDTVSLFAISLVGDPIRPINVNADPVIYIVRDDSTNPATHTLKIEPASGSLLAMDPPDPDWDINGKVPPRNG